MRQNARGVAPEKGTPTVSKRLRRGFGCGDSRGGAGGTLGGGGLGLGGGFVREVGMVGFCLFMFPFLDTYPMARNE